MRENGLLYLNDYKDKNCQKVTKIVSRGKADSFDYLPYTPYNPASVNK